MNLHIFEAVILGSVQGVTEFLPISSTAHLIVTQRLFGLDQAVYGLSFDMFTNLGTVLAVIIFFWKDLVSVFGKMRLPGKTPFTREEKLPWFIILATIPVGLVGLALESYIESTFRSLWVIVVMLVAVGFLMIAAEKYSKKKKSHEPKPWQVFVTGLSQCIALIPGTSRSGITISTALFSGLDRITAARYSFLLSVPIVSAAALKRVSDFGGEVAKGNVASDVLLFYGIGALFAFITGYLSLQFLFSFYRKHSLTAFAYYRFILAGILVLLIGTIGA